MCTSTVLIVASTCPLLTSYTQYQGGTRPYEIISYQVGFRFRFPFTFPKDGKKKTVQQKKTPASYEYVAPANIWRSVTAKQRQGKKKKRKIGAYCCTAEGIHKSNRNVKKAKHVVTHSRWKNTHKTVEEKQKTTRANTSTLPAKHDGAEAPPPGCPPSPWAPGRDCWAPWQLPGRTTFRGDGPPRNGFWRASIAFPHRPHSAAKKQKQKMSKTHERERGQKHDVRDYKLNVSKNNEQKSWKRKDRSTMLGTKLNVKQKQWAKRKHRWEMLGTMGLGGGRGYSWNARP